MDILSSTMRVKASALPLEKLATNTQVTEADKAAEVGRQFEAVLLRQILDQAQKNAFSSASPSSSLSKGIYQDMVTNQLADAMSKAGTIGLAHSFQQQLTQQLQTAKPAPDKPCLPPADAFLKKP